MQKPKKFWKTLFGEQDMHAVKIIFDPASESLFKTEQFLIKGN